jgi:hypothetical protein
MRGIRYRKLIVACVFCLALSVLSVISLSACGGKDAKPDEPATQTIKGLVVSASADGTAFTVVGAEDNSNADESILAIPAELGIKVGDKVVTAKFAGINGEADKYPGYTGYKIPILNDIESLDVATEGLEIWTRGVVFDNAADGQLNIVDYDAEDFGVPVPTDLWGRKVSLTDECRDRIEADIFSKFEGIDKEADSASEEYQSLVDQIDKVSKYFAAFSTDLVAKLDGVKSDAEEAKSKFDAKHPKEKPGNDIPQKPVGKGKEALYDFKIENKEKGYSLRYEKSSGHIYVHYGNLPGDKWMQIFDDALATQKPKDPSWHKKAIDMFAYKDAVQWAQGGHLGPMLATYMFPDYDDYVKYAGWLHEALVIVE